MSRLRQLHTEKVVPLPLLNRREGDLQMSWVRQHAEKIVLLPLLAGVIAGIISLVGALNHYPIGEPRPLGEDHAAPSLSEDYRPNAQ